MKRFAKNRTYSRDGRMLVAKFKRRLKRRINELKTQQRRYQNYVPFSGMR
jgi:hypothetical protein